MPRFLRAVAVAAAVLAVPVLVPATSVAAAATRPCPQLRLADNWYGDNAAKIQKVIDERGRCGGKHGERPVAVFDWDNTVIKNDISDQTVFWMIGHDKVLQPRNKDWRTTSRFMTDAGANALSKACGTATRPGNRCRRPRTSPAPTNSSR